MDTKNKNHEEKNNEVQEINLVNPFQKSSKLGTSPKGDAADKEQKKTEQATPVAAKTAHFLSALQNLRNVADGTENAVEHKMKKAMETLNELHEFAKDKNNLHKEIKTMIVSARKTMGEIIEDMKGKKVVSKDGDTPAGKTSSALSGSQAGTPKPQDTPSQGKRRRNIDENRTGRSPRLKKHRTDDTRKERTPKRADTKEDEGFTVVTHRRSKRPEGRRPEKKVTNRRTRPDAIMIEAANGNSYADILRKVKSDPNLKEMGENVLRVKRTQKGQLLFEMKREDGQDKKEYQELVEKALGTDVTVRMLTQEATIVCKDIDEITTKEEVLAAIQDQLQGIIDGAAIKSLRATYGGTQTAVICLPIDKAKKLLAVGKVKIGWTICRIRESVRPMTCFKCLDFGHMAKDCKNPDRSKLCRRCGQEGHIAAKCQKEPICLLCGDKAEGSQGHITGSSRCPRYRTAANHRRT